MQTTLFEITNRYLSQMLGGQLDVETGWEQYRAEFEEMCIRDRRVPGTAPANR